MLWLVLWRLFALFLGWLCFCFLFTSFSVFSCIAATFQPWINFLDFRLSFNIKIGFTLTVNFTQLHYDRDCVLLLWGFTAVDSVQQVAIALKIIILKYYYLSNYASVIFSKLIINKCMHIPIWETVFYATRTAISTLTSHKKWPQ